MRNIADRDRRRPSGNPGALGRGTVIELQVREAQRLVAVEGDSHVDIAQAERRYPAAVDERGDPKQLAATLRAPDRAPEQP